MREIVIEYYKQGIYTDENLGLFVEVGWLTAGDYKDLSGKEYKVGE